MRFRFVSILIVLLDCLVSSSIGGDEEITLDNVKRWAENIGIELWEIGKEVTKLQNIETRYSEMKASVEQTDGEEILKTIVRRMNKLVKEKVDAVLRIKNAAMQAEKNSVRFNNSEERFAVAYYSSKFSNYNIQGQNHMEIIDEEDKPSESVTYANMTLAPDPHFKDVLVNTNYSSVHVPTNIFDRWDYVITPIQWSQAIDGTFISNYEIDPSLMWQYYASTSGFLRHYPAFHWSMKPDKYDCRRRIWYIQAATCSKEVVILIDNSGTMYGMKNTIAQLTVDSLLQTFSNNDYISIFRLTGDNVTGLVKCFEDTLIQATPENIALFKNALYRMCPEKKINFPEGFKKAFRILHDFLKNKSESAEKRNQAVFLLTDMLPSTSELETIRRDYESVYNDTNIQVELFIYFIGKDISDIREIQWEKCLRNGSIVHVRTMDEVPEDALKYLSIIARTQNESTNNYPVSWTHTFFDIKRKTQKANDTNEVDDEIIQENEEEDTEYGNLKELRIMTSVTTPVYASKRDDKVGLGSERYSRNKKEELIGVAAIDVPIADFKRLTMAHKIGVNGYAFVVTNNGYVLFHPDLRPVVDNRARDNFNSVDLTEVEFFDDDSVQPRHRQEKILKLREEMVNQTHGNLPEIKIKFHYDDQKRVGTEYRNYFYDRLECSPFSIGLALPRGYGNYWVKTTEEIDNARKKGEDFQQYFRGDWTIHPDWTYCDFRNNTKYDPQFKKDRRKKLLHFLDKIFNDENFEWRGVEEHGTGYESNTSSMNPAEYAEYCFGERATKMPNADDGKDYFCDEELMELLFFDAKLTAPEFDTNKDDKSFMEAEKIKLKFVATQAGLTRWKSFIEDNSNTASNKIWNKNFGDRNGTALDEVWYKSAVLLHEKDSQTFVLSIPQIPRNGNLAESLITASYAVFYHEKGYEAPGVVVGFQFTYETLKNIAEKDHTSACNQGSNWDCYIIDANGYIIYSKYDHEVGKFYGTINGGGALMKDMVENGLYRNITMFDYQGLKDEERKDPSYSVGASSSLTNPLRFVVWSLNWIFSNLIWLLLETNLWQFVNAASSCSSVTSLKNTTSCSTCKHAENKSCPVCCKAPKQYEDTCQTREVTSHMERLGLGTKGPKKIPVDRRSFLYLYTKSSIDGYSSTQNHSRTDDCSRPYFLQRIKYTNLNLLLVRSNHSACFINVDVEPVDILYSQEEDGSVPACNKKMINAYPRKKLLGCSDKVLLLKRTVEFCGTGAQMESSPIITFSTLILSVLFIYMFLQC